MKETFSMVPTFCTSVCRQQHLPNHKKTKTWTVNVGHILHRQLNSLSLKQNSRRCLWKKTVYAHTSLPRITARLYRFLFGSAFPQKTPHLTPLQYTQLILWLPSTSIHQASNLWGGKSWCDKKYRIWRFWWLQGEKNCLSWLDFEGQELLRVHVVERA